MVHGWSRCDAGNIHTCNFFTICFSAAFHRCLCAVHIYKFQCSWCLIVGYTMVDRCMLTTYGTHSNRYTHTHFSAQAHKHTHTHFIYKHLHRQTIYSTCQVIHTIELQRSQYAQRRCFDVCSTYHKVSFWLPSPVLLTLWLFCTNESRAAEYLMSVQHHSLI